MLQHQTMTKMLTMRANNHQKVHGKGGARKTVVTRTTATEALHIFVLHCSGRRSGEGMMMTARITEGMLISTII